jgi:hypothetical protein
MDVELLGCEEVEVLDGERVEDPALLLEGVVDVLEEDEVRVVDNAVDCAEEEMGVLEEEDDEDDDGVEGGGRGHKGDAEDDVIV